MLFRYFNFQQTFIENKIYDIYYKICINKNFQRCPIFKNRWKRVEIDRFLPDSFRSLVSKLRDKIVTLINSRLVEHRTLSRVTFVERDVSDDNDSIECGK